MNLKLSNTNITYMAAVSYTKNGKRFKKYAGRFNDEKEAAKAYNTLAIKLHGDKAILNSLEEEKCHFQ